MSSTMAAGRRGTVLILALCLLLALFAGCRDKTEEEKSPKAEKGVEAPLVEEQKPRAQPQAQPQSQLGPEERGTVYALSEPLPPASAEELALAQRRVDYANIADRELSSLCGRYPQLIMLGVEEYRNSYTTLGFGKDKPSATCMAYGIAPARGVFDPEETAELKRLLAEMDRLRQDMDRDYESLRSYVKDTSIVDDGRLGSRLAGQIEKNYRAYAQSQEKYRSIVESRAAEAQDTILRDHPLRDHVRMAADMMSILRRIADGLEVSDPDPASLDKPIARLREDITRAERLPFPVPGATEMHYRHFLKDARGLLALLMRGQLESFHVQVRTSLNAQWSSCRQKYNAFVDALANS